MSETTNPVIVLVQPQLGENIGTAARAMYNGGLTELRLVKPKKGWPNEYAIKPAAGAIQIIEEAKVFETTTEAVADLQLVLATTARPRDMIKRVYTPRKAAEVLLSHAQNEKVGVLFGPERTGLYNDDIALADGVITVPLNPDYTSLNLAQAVLLVAYEWFQAKDAISSEQYLCKGDRAYAKKDEMLGLFEHLESELDRSGFLRVAHKRPIMVRNIRNMLLRADLTSQEVRTLRGIISDLVDPYYADRSGGK